MNFIINVSTIIVNVYKGHITRGHDVIGLANHQEKEKEEEEGEEEEKYSTTKQE